MKTSKSLGICMDHFSARLMTFNTNLIQTTIIDSKFTHPTKAENLIYRKEQQSNYYKQVSIALKNYDDVILFGPTDAKIEFLSCLIDDTGLPNIKIRIKHTDTMTDFQQQAFVRHYFSGIPLIQAMA
jgi:hypothetical protein